MPTTVLNTDCDTFIPVIAKTSKKNSIPMYGDF